MCNTHDMGVNERRERLARAGAWLRKARARRYPKAVDFARAIGIERSLLSRYETGSSEVPDERAERIAEALGLDIITVRRNLGLWVPESSIGRAEMLMDQNERMAADLVARVQRLNERKRQAVEEVVRAFEEDQASAREPDGNKS